MKTDMPNAIHTDVLIIGGGGAGLRAAIEAREHNVDVLIVSQSRVGYGSNTAISGGGFAAVSAASRISGDSLQEHLLDTIAGGYYLNDQGLVDTMVSSAEQQIEDLHRFGVRYTTTEESPWLTLSIDHGHRFPRLIYGKNAFGTDFTLPLRNHALQRGVRFTEGIIITRLLKNRDKVVGAIGIDSRGEAVTFSTSAVILTSGGLGQAYLHTDTAAGTTGDGYALAYEAGAVLQDMEFVQFYPTSLGSGTPALFYECTFFDTGGKLINRLGEDIMAKHGLNEPMLPTRDRLSLAIARELADGLGFDDKVILDLTEVPDEKMDMLLDILPRPARRAERRLPVAPTAHFHMGGIRINSSAEPSIPCLYAAGEVCAGVHGANRLSGNALTELWSFGTIAGREAARKAKEAGNEPMPEDDIAAEMERLTAFDEGVETAERLRQSLKETMWHRVGIIRDGQGLKQALNELAAIGERYPHVSATSVQELKQAVRLGNTLTASEMVCRAALYRNESRGAHYRQDNPEQDNDRWLCNVLITGEEGRMALSTEPVKLIMLSP